jgi:hypothetical protein
VGGNVAVDSHVSLLVTICPGESDSEETLATLQFAHQCHPTGSLARSNGIGSLLHDRSSLPEGLSAEAEEHIRHLRDQLHVMHMKLEDTKVLYERRIRVLSATPPPVARPSPTASSSSYDEKENDNPSSAMGALTSRLRNADKLLEMATGNETELRRKLDKRTSVCYPFSSLNSTLMMPCI